MKLHRFGSTLPFTKPFFAFTAGIAIAEATQLALPGEVVVTLLAIALILHRIRVGSNSVVFLKSLALLLTIATAGAHLLYKASQPVPELRVGHYQGQVRLDENVRCGSDYCSTIGEIHVSDTLNTLNSVRVRFSFPIDSAATLDSSHYLKTGCNCYFEGQYKPYEPQRNPYSFDGERYAFEQRLSGRMIVQSFNCQQASPSARDQGRHALRTTLDRLQNPEVSALFYALLSGDKSELSERTRTHFARCGIMHLLAVSGLHVGLIAWLPLLLLRFIYLRSLRFTMALLIAMLVWGFAWFTGLSASVTRAAAMISLMALGLAFRKRVSTLNSLAAVGLFMLITAPRLLFNAGFLLSFSAVAAIVLWTPIMTDRFYFRSPVKRYILQSSAVAIAAQAGTSPISVYYFKQLPLLFLPANLIAVPLATLCLYVLLITLILESFGVSVDALFYLLNLMGSSLLFIAAFIGETSIAALDRLEITLFESLLWMALMAAIFSYLAARSKNKGMLITVLSLVLIVSAHFRQDDRTELVLFSSYGDPLIGLTGRMGAHLLLWNDQQRTYAANSWSAYNGAQALVMREGLDTTLHQVSVRRKGDWVQIGPVLIAKKNFNGERLPADQQAELVTRGRSATIISQHLNETSLDLSEHAIATRINSNGTIGRWYDRRKLPNRLPLP